jgi:hypothetical protein
MILSGISVVVLLVMLVGHEFDLSSPGHGPKSSNAYPTLPPEPTVNKNGRELSKSTKKPSFGRTSSIHMEHDDLSRLIRHLNGEFVFPSPKTGAQIHRRNKSSKPELDSGFGAPNPDTQSGRSSATLLESLEEYE